LPRKYHGQRDLAGYSPQGDNLYGEIERRQGVGHVEDGVVIRNRLIKEIDICTKFPRGEGMHCISWGRVFPKEKRQVQKP